MPNMTQRSFTSGEIAPALRSRADLVKYTTGLAKCENFFIRPQGGAYNRPGLRFVGELCDCTTKGRIIPFSFNTEQTYILVFEHLKMRVVKDAGYILDGLGEIYEIVTPYTSAELERIYFTQDADVMTLAHPNHPPKTLKRFGDTDWQIDNISFTSTVVSPTGLTAVNVGSGCGDFAKKYRYVITTVSQDGIESVPSVEISRSNNSLSTTCGVKLEWTAVTGADYYRVYKDPSDGSGFYGWIGDTKVANFTDFNIAPITSDAPPVDRNPFSSANNYPSVVSYYQQRQVYANTLNEPQTVFTSQTGIYNSLRLSSPSRDDDAVTFTLKAQQVNEIRHVIPLNVMVIMTSGGEWKVTEGQDQVLSPSTVGVRTQSFNGAAWVKPVVINSNVIFVQDKGARVRDLGYEFSSDAYTGNDLSLMSEHLVEGHQITAMAYAGEPYGIVWCVRDDGVLLGLTYQREHQVWGWHQHTTDGKFEDVAVITEGNRDVPYFIVKRTINGVTKRYVERLAPRVTSEPNESFYVDSGVTYRGEATTIIGGLTHLEGESVAVLADGYTVSNLVVESGQITLPRAASLVHIGLPYTGVVETLDLDVQAPTESMKLLEVSVSKVTIEMEKSRGGYVGPLKDDGSSNTIYEIKPRYDSDNYDQIQLKDFKFEVFIEPQWSKGGGLRIEQRDPLPMSILSITPRVDIGG